VKYREGFETRQSLSLLTEPSFDMDQASLGLPRRRAAAN
jgi:hypothetical protein